MQTTKEDSPTQKRLYPIFTVSTAIAFGCMLATLEALRPDANGFSFQVTYMTGIAFLAGAAIAFPVWRLILNGTRLGQRQMSFATGAMVVVLLVVGVGAFLYPLRFVPRSKWPEIRTGLLTAACALSCVAGLLWGVKRLMDSEDKAEMESEDSKPSSAAEKKPD